MPGCLLLLLLLGRRPGSASPEAGSCLRAADLLSCSGLGLDRVPPGLPASALTLDLSHNRLTRLGGASFGGLARLEALTLAHNQLGAIQAGAFRNASGPRLRRLDLSSNRLQALRRHHLEDLPGLEELLLFHNRLVQVEGGALAGAARLRKLYLSHNRLEDFPFSSLRRRPALALLDLSSNRLSSLPLAALSALAPPTQRGLYLHRNPLRCDCALLRLLAAWQRRRFAPVGDFLQQHVCLLFGVHAAAVRFLQHRRYLDRCEGGGLAALTQQGASASVAEGQALLLPCAAAPAARNLSVVWVSPRQEDVVAPGNGGALTVHANGSLEIAAARAEDAGVYWCLALDPLQRRNQTREVNVTVLARAPGRRPPPFSTALTTLLGCLGSLLLLLAYLYLPPCRCPAPPPTRDASILGPAPPGAAAEPGRKVGGGKHVAFREPIGEQHNGRPAGTEKHTDASAFAPGLSP